MQANSKPEKNKSVKMDKKSWVVFWKKDLFK